MTEEEFYKKAREKYGSHGVRQPQENDELKQKCPGSLDLTYAKPTTGVFTQFVPNRSLV